MSIFQVSQQNSQSSSQEDSNNPKLSSRWHLQARHSKYGQNQQIEITENIHATDDNVQCGHLAGASPELCTSGEADEDGDKGTGKMKDKIIGDSEVDKPSHSTIWGKQAEE